MAAEVEGHHAAILAGFLLGFLAFLGPVVRALSAHDCAGAILQQGATQENASNFTCASDNICGDLPDSPISFSSRLSPQCSALFESYQSSWSKLGVSNLISRDASRSCDKRLANSASNPIIISSNSTATFAMCTVPKSGCSNIRKLLYTLVADPIRPDLDALTQFLHPHFYKYPTVWFYDVQPSQSNPSPATGAARRLLTGDRSTLDKAAYDALWQPHQQQTLAATTQLRPEVGQEFPTIPAATSGTTASEVEPAPAATTTTSAIITSDLSQARTPSLSPPPAPAYQPATAAAPLSTTDTAARATPPAAAPSPATAPPTLPAAASPPSTDAIPAPATPPAAATPPASPPAAGPPTATATVRGFPFGPPITADTSAAAERPRQLPADVPTFVVGRNPYLRLVSGFRDKMVHNPARTDHHTMQDVNDFLGFPKKSPWEDSGPAFRRFVRALWERGVTAANDHFRPAAHICGGTRRFMHDYYLRLEDMQTWFPCLMDGLGLRGWTERGWGDTPFGRMYLGGGAGGDDEAHFVTLRSYMRKEHEGPAPRWDTAAGRATAGTRGVDWDWVRADQCWWNPPGVSCAEYYAGFTAQDGRVVPGPRGSAYESAGRGGLRGVRGGEAGGVGGATDAHVTSSSAQWRDFYDQETADLVYLLYAIDFEAFGYERAVLGDGGPR